LDCNNNSIETVLGIPGATDIEYRWYSDNMNAPVEGTLDTPPPGTYTLEITYMLPGVAEPVCCSQEIIVNDWGLDVEMEIRRQGETTPITEVCLGENVVLVSKCRIVMAVSALRPPLLSLTPRLLWHLLQILILHVRERQSL